jgi:hypothetical protein
MIALPDVPDDDVFELTLDEFVPPPPLTPAERERRINEGLPADEVFEFVSNCADIYEIRDLS